MTRRVVVVGAGVAGLTTAWSLLSSGDGRFDVVVLEADDRTGGRIRTSPFAGLDRVDEAADSFLRRVPFALALADEIGLGDSLVSPTDAHASIWHDGLHRIPAELLLGVPASPRAFINSRLISPLGKARAALEPVLPRTRDEDCIGAYVRSRFGAQVQERLVDPLVGSIYAADTDRFSLAAVPQIAALTTERSMLVAASRARAKAAAAPSGPIFAAPSTGVGTLVETLAARIVAAGGRIVTGARVSAVERDGGAYVVHTGSGSHAADDVVVASPARPSSEFLRGLDPAASALLAEWVHASVVIVTLAIPRDEWPHNLTGSGYLVPKPDQRWVTAASFASNKWAHLRPADGSMIVRVSLGRDGLDVDRFDDDSILNLTLADLKHHLGVDFSPDHVRVSRWAGAFPQYRPHHFDRLANIEQSFARTAPHVRFVGASYRGIGIPACVQQARAVADKIRIVAE